MQWAPSCSQNMCKIPNRLSACADLVSTCTPTFTPSSLHSPLPDPYQDSICMPSSLGESLPHDWFRVLDFAKKKKKNSNFLPPSLWRNPWDFKLFFFFPKKKKEGQNQHSSAKFQANLFQLGSRNYICQQSVSWGHVPSWYTYAKLVYFHLPTQSLQSCPALCNFATLWTVAYQVPLFMGFFRKNTGVGCHSLLQGIFPTQGSNLGLLNWQMILYH